MTTDAVSALISMINAGDLDAARGWAAENAGALWALRSQVGARTDVAHACVRWGAPMVWPWGDAPALTSADQRLLSSVRSGNSWRANEDTIVRLLAYGLVRYEEGRLRAA